MENDQNESKGKNSNSNNGNSWGYDLYPERRGEKFKPTFSGFFFGFEGNEGMQKMKCERKVYKVTQTSKWVKLMMGALKSSGCPIDLRRHIVCEVCNPNVSGGYDPELNQIVVCQNTCTSEGVVQGVLVHEMIHMFDYCNNKLDFKNIDHLACTEIRAANLTHCSFISSLLQADINLFNIKARHKECVKHKAVESIIAVRDVSVEEARAAVNRVFSRCYADLEPVGRRIKVNSNDAHRAYAEGFLYGYN